MKIRKTTRNVLGAGLVALVGLLMLGSIGSLNALQPAGPLASYYDVRDYGATGDGTTLDSPSIDKAIETAADAGGGTVFFPQGTYLCGTIHLRSNVHLYFAQGSKILAADWRKGVYDAIEDFPGTAYQDGGHTYFRNSLIYGENLENITISGPGMIDGSGLAIDDGPQDQISGFADWHHHENARKVAQEKPDRHGNKAIALKLCRNIIMRDFTILKGGHFAIITTGCDGLTIDNVTIDTNRDGIDLDCCRNVMVSNCRVNSPNDDGICPKSSFALGRKVITENMTITNCMVSGFQVGTLLDGTMKPNPGGRRYGRIKFGTEANGGFRNITVSNCVFRECLGLALEEVDGGILENITINNITMMDNWVSPIFIRLGRRNRGPVDSVGTSTVRNILISNIIAETSGNRPNSGIMVMGIPGHSIENVRLQNIQLIYHGGGTKADADLVPPEDEEGYPEPLHSGIPSYGLYARHVKGLELADIHMTYKGTEMRPAIVADDVQGLEIDNVKAKAAPGLAPTKFTDVERLVVRDSPDLKLESARQRPR
ncbi:MAG: glycoside hydrolase family 28 protein [Acidobacteriota bacterium]